MVQHPMQRHAFAETQDVQLQLDFTAHPQLVHVPAAVPATIPTEIHPIPLTVHVEQMHVILIMECTAFNPPIDAVMPIA